MSEETRPIGAFESSDGSVVGKVNTSLESNKLRGRMVVPSPHVIPIIFLPGIMGSNLKAKSQRLLQRKVLAKAGDPVWRIDSAISFGLRWRGVSAAERQVLIDKGELLVDDRGVVDRFEASDRATRAGIEDLKGQDPALADAMSKYWDERLQAREVRRARGWGTVSWEFYGDFLNWLEFSLTNLSKIDGKPSPSMAALLGFDGSVPDGSESKRPDPISKVMIDKLPLFQFPIHAFGYNWADTNLESGRLLADYIGKTIKAYADRPGVTCDKVIVVTHSMGGLVARAAAMEFGAKDAMLAVIHGVMPTHGAAAMYKRAVAGFGGETYSWNPIARLKGRIGGSALGASSLETIPILAFNPGPFELAPNKIYQSGRPWLIIKDKAGNLLKQLPERGDPYSEIYRNINAWWRAVDPSRLNPAAQPGTSGVFVGKYMACIAQAESYHDKLAVAGFHPVTFGHYSVDTGHSAWGQLVYEAVVTEVYTPSAYAIGPGVPVLPISQRIEMPKEKIKGNVDDWSIVRHDGDDEMLLRNNQGQEIKIRIARKADAGDSTVPADASASGLDRHAAIVCKHVPGYEHDASYGDARVRQSVLDAIIRAVKAVKVTL